VRFEAADRAGLERLLRYCARPAFASERLHWDGYHRSVRYILPKPLPSGQSQLMLSLLELLDRLAAPIPTPRRHWHPSQAAPGVHGESGSVPAARHGHSHGVAVPSCFVIRRAPRQALRELPAIEMEIRI